jgi:hypothetical protein
MPARWGWRGSSRSGWDHATDRADLRIGSSSPGGRRGLGTMILPARIDSREGSHHAADRLIACLGELHPFLRDPKPCFPIARAPRSLCLLAGFACFVPIFFCRTHRGILRQGREIVCSKLLTWNSEPARWRGVAARCPFNPRERWLALAGSPGVVGILCGKRNELARDELGWRSTLKRSRTDLPSLNPVLKRGFSVWSR